MAVSSSNGSTSLLTFPANKIDALTMLYLQNQNLSGKTPEEIATMYDDAYKKISAQFDLLRNEQKELKNKENPYHPIW